MRKERTLRISISIALALVPALLPVAVQANHRPNLYCSESGDVCLTTAKDDGVRKLRIGLAAKYFQRYRLCVVAPNDSRTCKSFDIERHGDVYGDSVRWSRHFPNEGSGAYTVIWKNSGERIGKKLGFHVS